MKTLFFLICNDLVLLFVTLLQINPENNNNNIYITAAGGLVAAVVTLFFLYKSAQSEMKKMSDKHAEKLENIYQKVVTETQIMATETKNALKDNTISNKELSSTISAHINTLNSIANDINRRK